MADFKVNARDVRIGTPDQLTTGAVMFAPLGTELPDNTDITKDGISVASAFEAAGYVSSDGLTLTPDYSTSDITEWGGALVRRILESFSGTLSWTMIETNERSLKVAFGAQNVTATAASAEHGAQLAVAIGAQLPDPASWVFKMKDGDARIMIVVPNGQVTTIEEVTFSATDAIGWGVELSTYADENGKCIYIYTDDGLLATA